MSVWPFMTAGSSSCDGEVKGQYIAHRERKMNTVSLFLSLTQSHGWFYTVLNNIAFPLMDPTFQE